MTKSGPHDQSAFDALNDPAAFLQKIWGTMPPSLADIPGLVIPTLSVADIDKQIADLQAVDGWLEMNRTMLRSTIQALELQKATVVNLQKQKGSDQGDATSSSTTKDHAAQMDAGAWWNTLQTQFAQAMEQVNAAQAAATSTASSSATTAKQKPAAASKKAPAKKTPAKKPASSATKKKK